MGIKPLILTVLDGWGVASKGPGNAIAQAYKPFFDQISLAYPHTILLASGEAVGLPGGEAGNSEVGHLNIGAGMIVYQELPRIDMAIRDGTFLQNSAFLAASENTKKNDSALHLLGLVGQGTVHSSNDHLYALLWFARTQGLKDVYLHLFTDGRDSPPTSGLQVLQEVLNKISEIGIGKMASVSGRYYAMDRDNRWERTKKAYEAIVSGIGPRQSNPLQAVSESYHKGVTDEFVEPTLIVEPGKDPHTVTEGDSIIFFNFRPDRARQMVKAFVQKDFRGFPRVDFLQDIKFVTMTEYEKDLPVLVAFPPPVIDFPLAAILSMNDLRQLHIGETEKYAHVTYFINGGREEPYPGEFRVHIPSPKVSTYDKKPEMSSLEITDYVCKSLENNQFDFYFINFANADMVAHSGSLPATIKAIETLDQCLERIGNMVLARGGAMIVTADHGNAEVMINPTSGGIDTEHSLNPVPFIVVSEIFKTKQNLRLPSGILADVAPTILSLLGIQKPESMTGKNLLLP